MHRYFWAPALIILGASAWLSGQTRAPQCDPDNGGLKLSAGFCAKVMADEVGAARHIAVAANGDLFVALRGNPKEPGAVVVLRDSDRDGRFDMRERFGEAGGTGITLRNGYVWVAQDDAVVRYPIKAGDMKPSGPAETIVTGFPVQPIHTTKTMAFDNKGGLYVANGMPSSTCAPAARAPGLNPCTQLENAGGVWRFDENRAGQVFMKAGRRYSTGLRSTNSLAWHPDANALYLMQHGRSALNQWPEYFTNERNAEEPAEELQRVDDGVDFGHPYCYYNPSLKKRMLAPEYGGDGKKEGDCAKYPAPAAAYPAHWAPNDMMVYTGAQFGPQYRNGLFIAFHGGASRAPLPQGGYNVVFQPMRDGKPSGNYEIFADGFAGKPVVMKREEATARPMGLAQGPDGSLYVIDSVKGKVWRVSKK